MPGLRAPGRATVPRGRLPVPGWAAGPRAASPLTAPGRALTWFNARVRGGDLAQRSGVVGLRARSTSPGRAHGARAVERGRISPANRRSPRSRRRPCRCLNARRRETLDASRRKRPPPRPPRCGRPGAGPADRHAAPGPVADELEGSPAARRPARLGGRSCRDGTGRPDTGRPRRRGQRCASGGWPTLPALSLSVVRVRMTSPAVTGSVPYRVS